MNSCLLFVLIFLLCFISTSKASSDEEKTQLMINSLLTRYGEANLRYYVPCVLHASCANCTSGLFFNLNTKKYQIVFTSQQTPEVSIIMLLSAFQTERFKSRIQTNSVGQVRKLDLTFQEIHLELYPKR
jgi:hypothetical protein